MIGILNWFKKEPPANETPETKSEPYWVPNANQLWWNVDRNEIFQVDGRRKMIASPTTGWCQILNTKKITNRRLVIEYKIGKGQLSEIFQYCKMTKTSAGKFSEKKLPPPNIVEWNTEKPFSGDPRNYSWKELFPRKGKRKYHGGQIWQAVDPNTKELTFWKEINP